MQLVIILLMLIYIAALSRSFFPFGSHQNEQENLSFEATKSQSLAIEPFLFEDSNSKSSDGEDFNYTIPNISSEFRGKWSSVKNAKQLKSFSQISGLATFILRKEELSNSNDFVELWCYDGQYIDGKAMKIIFTYNTNATLDFSNFPFGKVNTDLQVLEFDSFIQTSDKICRGSYQLTFIDAQTLEPYKKTNDENENAVVQVSVHSAECDISINANVAASSPTYESSTMDYSIMMTLLCLGHLYACIQMIRNISQDELIGHGYSLITLTFLTSWDIFLCLFHFYQAFYAESTYFQYFISPAFWYFIVASIFETRLLTIVWKARYYSNFETTAEARKGFASFYLKLYGFLSALIFLGYNFLPNVWFFYATSIFFVPQIVHNCLRGQKPKFDILYIVFLGFLRTLLPMYVRGCPNSIFHLTPSEGFTLNYGGLIAIQIFLMYSQSKLGSRFFIPGRFLPAKFNYYITMKSDAFEKEENCSICMDHLGKEPSDSKTPILNASNKCHIQVMQTPCNHIFHGKCLNDWMEIKLECPYCRSTLPSLE